MVAGSMGCREQPHPIESNSYPVEWLQAHEEEREMLSKKDELTMQLKPEYPSLEMCLRLINNSLPSHKFKGSI